MSKPSILTSPQGFCRYPTGMLFSVNAGMPVELALEHASCLLDCVGDLATTITIGEGRGSEACVIQYLAEMAKALVDASSSFVDGAGGAQ